MGAEETRGSSELRLRRATCDSPQALEAAHELLEKSKLLYWHNLRHGES